ncbi:GNAT family N-acetyltransferase [Candidatus Woesearchaeota archaeon]|jgi:ribosomal protein S18 acetylase RimI-like enzyme|nr:GNAT family N-acetyltransferase [Candidatus Woesearchaeota archaeon]MBT3538299.1 GNAT family N-acetyltransferase [Candidatus Woesearchaeota archaeon]MBT4696707.1 GNAT family N-acetyltransferase [Candidatus Woesearchaeota archaeon]MBT4716825.1 GNAT family N-acetyltransferase [Candidatus Woesearchaeota archaeon]MBT7105968.1 GNAT family N-acetyltransferase [Candidatus Woesearchaeota archaeon]
MLVRKATLDDLDGICGVAEAVKLDYDAPQDSGFLVYGLETEEYAHRVEVSNHFYVAVDDSKIVGFLMCYDVYTLQGLVSSGRLDHEDTLTARVSEIDGEHVFGDQIAVLPSDVGRGAGNEMMSRLFSDMAENVMYVGVLLEPARNSVSIDFCERLGFVYRERLRNSDDHLWGLYKWER